MPLNFSLLDLRSRKSPYSALGKGIQCCKNMAKGDNRKLFEKTRTARNKNSFSNAQKG